MIIISLADPQVPGLASKAEGICAIGRPNRLEKRRRLVSTALGHRRGATVAVWLC
jgi:hypothetical protein